MSLVTISKDIVGLIFSYLSDYEKRVCARVCRYLAAVFNLWAKRQASMLIARYHLPLTEAEMVCHLQHARLWCVNSTRIEGAGVESWHLDDIIPLFICPHFDSILIVDNQSNIFAEEQLTLTMLLNSTQVQNWIASELGIQVAMTDGCCALIPRGIKITLPVKVANIGYNTALTETGELYILDYYAEQYLLVGTLTNIVQAHQARSWDKFLSSLPQQIETRLTIDTFRLREVFTTVIVLTDDNRVCAYCVNSSGHVIRRISLLKEAKSLVRVPLSHKDNNTCLYLVLHLDNRLSILVCFEGGRLIHDYKWKRYWYEPLIVTMEVHEVTYLHQPGTFYVTNDEGVFLVQHDLDQWLPDKLEFVIEKMSDDPDMSPLLTLIHCEKNMFYVSYD